MCSFGYLEHGCCFVQGCSALPGTKHAPVSRCRRRVFVRGESHQQRVLVTPVDPALELGSLEPAVHELLRRKIELAEDCRVRAARRERQHAALSRVEAGCPLEHPALAVGRAQRVDIENVLPGRLLAGLSFDIVGNRDPPPETSHVLGVLKQVVGVVTNDLETRQSIAARQIVERVVVDGLEARMGFEAFDRALVFGLDPLERLAAVDLFEPQVWIIFCTRGHHLTSPRITRGSVAGCKGDREHDDRDHDPEPNPLSALHVGQHIGHHVDHPVGLHVVLLLRFTGAPHPGRSWAAPCPASARRNSPTAGAGNRGPRQIRDSRPGAPADRSPCWPWSAHRSTGE